MSREENIQKYLESMKHEIGRLDPRFTGNIEFKLNFKEGMIGNLNVSKTMSVKLE